MLQPSSKRRRAGRVSHADLQRLKNIAHGGHDDRRDFFEPGDVDYDRWEEEAAAVAELKDPIFSFLDPSKPIREPKTLKHAAISLAANGKEVPAVKAPVAEVSYNPQSDDYFRAFTKAAEHEAKAERKRQREEADETARSERAVQIAAEVDEAEAEADRDHTEHDDDESAWEGLESEAEGAEWLRARRPERKTQAQRNRIARRKEAERRALHESQQRRRAQQTAEVKSIARAIEARSLASTRPATHTSDSEQDDATQGDDTVLRRRRLGKAFVPEPCLELVLPSELQESLRLLKPEGNLLRDRFRSLLVRGKLETRQAIQQPKRARRSVTEKWTYKDWRLK